MAKFGVAMLLGLVSVWAAGQDAGPKSQAGGGKAAVGAPAEAQVAGMVRKDPHAVGLAAPGKRVGRGVDAGPELLLHDFSLAGAAAATHKLHFKALAPGVMEITGPAYPMGTWQFKVRDAANYY